MRNQLLKEITDSKFFTVMADEVTDVSNTEQVSIVISYVNNALEVKEVFLDLVSTDHITGEAMSKLIAGRLLSWDLRSSTDGKLARSGI